MSHIANLSTLLEKMTSIDKDFRFMATNDLMIELKNDSIKLDDDSERKIVKILLKLLEDKNGEVQNLAVKCLGPLVTKVKESQIDIIVDCLCTNMLSDKEQLKDISSIGLKTLISKLPSIQTQMSHNIIKKITSRLLNTIQKDDINVQLETLDVLADILSNFGNILISYHTQLLTCLIQQLHSQRLAVRKRAINALSFLMSSCNQTLFVQLLNTIVNELKKKSTSLLNKTFIQLLTSLSKQSGQKIGDNLDTLIPLLMYYSQSKDDELIEYSLQAFESFVRKCSSQQIASYIQDIVNLCIKYIQYDPNYNYDDDDDNDGDKDGNGDNDGDTNRMETSDNDDEDEDGDYSDDDDVSWKIRRAAAKCLEAIILTRREHLKLFYSKIAPILIKRFKEREETVRCDLFNAYLCILQSTKSLKQSGTISVDEYEENRLSVKNEIDKNNDVEDDDDDDDDDNEAVKLLKEQIPLLMKSIGKMLKDKSIKTRQSIYLILYQLCALIPNCLASHMSIIIHGLQYSLVNDKHSTSNMKIDTLTFMHQLFVTHEQKLFYTHLNQLTQLVVACVKDSFYKIVSDSLLVSIQLSSFIKSCPQDNLQIDLLIQLFNSILARLKQTDIDQEVKERAILSIGHLVSNTAHLLSNQVTSACWPILYERLKNEITRLTTVKSIKLIADTSSILLNTDNNNNNADLKQFLNDSLPLISSYLKKNNRTLRLVSINCLLSIYKLSTHLNIQKDLLKTQILPDVCLLINDNDLHITQLTLKLLQLIVKQMGPLVVQSKLLDSLLDLIQSPLLQGLALDTLIELFQSIASFNHSSLTYKDLIQMLIRPIHNPKVIASKSQQANQQEITLTINKQAFYSISKCIAKLLIDFRQQDDMNLINQLILDVKSSKSNDSIKLLSLLTIGETGKCIDIFSGTYEQQLEECILNSFNSQQEEIKSAASYALGYLSLSNLNKYIPFILQEIEVSSLTNTKRQYLLLNSLKEIINYLSINSTSASSSLSLSCKHIANKYLNDVWRILIKNSELNEEGTRNIIAECLGKLILLNIRELIPKLIEIIDSTQATSNLKSTIISSIKFTITHNQNNKELDDSLNKYFIQFLSLLKDSNIQVKRVTLITFNSTIHNKPKLIKKILLLDNEFLTLLYNETRIRKDLIREVEMGPFRHTVDDGLDLRKSAFECMYTLLDTSTSTSINLLDCLNINEFLEHVELGLKDHYDIKMLTYLMLIKLSTLCPQVILHKLDTLVEPLKQACLQKVRTNAVKQEYEKNDELKRSALRALNALINNIQDADKHPFIIDFLNNIKTTPDLLAIYESIQKDFYTSGASATARPAAAAAAVIGESTMDTN